MCERKRRNDDFCGEIKQFLQELSDNHTSTRVLRVRTWQFDKCLFHLWFICSLKVLFTHSTSLSQLTLEKIWKSPQSLSLFILRVVRPFSSPLLSVVLTHVKIHYAFKLLTTSSCYFFTISIHQLLKFCKREILIKNESFWEWSRFLKISALIKCKNVNKKNV